MFIRSLSWISNSIMRETINLPTHELLFYLARLVEGKKNPPILWPADEYREYRDIAKILNDKIMIASEAELSQLMLYTVFPKWIIIPTPEKLTLWLTLFSRKIAFQTLQISDRFQNFLNTELTQALLQKNLDSRVMVTQITQIIALLDYLPADKFKYTSHILQRVYDALDALNMKKELNMHITELGQIKLLLNRDGTDEETQRIILLIEGLQDDQQSNHVVAWGHEDQIRVSRFGTGS